MPTADTKKTPYDFIQRNYRVPETEDPIEKWLPHPHVARRICRAVGAWGIDPPEHEDALQDVYVKALQAFRKKKTPAPRDLRAMKSFCATVAKNHAINTLRDRSRRERDMVGNCDPDEYTPLEYAAEKRDAIDAARQLEILAQLFRKHRMPKNGVEILEGVASGCTYEQLASELEITPDAVEGRMRLMRERFHVRMEKLGLLPDMLPLAEVVAMPGAIDALRSVA